MNIILLGFMGCGKTTIGKLLADKMDLDFIDLDNFIEANHNTTITQLFSEKGEIYFREVEKEALKTIVQKNNTVISIGGGTPCFFDNMQLVNANSVSIYLKQSVNSLYESLKSDRQQRPLISSLTDVQLKNFITEQLTKRDPYYQMAHYKVKAKDLLVGALADFLKIHANLATISV